MSLKSLEVRKKEILSEIRILHDKMMDVSESIKNKERSLSKIQNQIDCLTKDIVVSEHAILRFAERVMGLEPKKIEQIILTEPIKAAIRGFNGNGKFQINSKCKAVVKNNVVVTIEET